MQKYSLNVTNNSNSLGNICVPQNLPDQPENAVSLVWYNKNDYPAPKFDWKPGSDSESKTSKLHGKTS